MTSPISADDLVAALSLETYMALFDDDNTGNRSTVDASPGVVACLEDADAEIATWLENLYPGANIPIVASKAIASIRRRYAVILAYQRRPEYTKTYGGPSVDTLMTEHVARMERFAKATQRIPAIDGPPSPTPPNVGGYIGSGNPDCPLPNPKTFIDGTGDF